MRDILDRLVRYLVTHARLVEPTIASTCDPSATYGIHTNDEYVNIGHVLACLYVTPHPANPYSGDPKAVALYRQVVEAGLSKWMDEYRDTGAITTDEWGAFVVSRGLELLGGCLDPELQGRMRRFLELDIEGMIRRPFFFTAPNHEIWKLVDIAVAGRVMGRPDWIQHAVFQTGQLIAYQTAEGFWEEGRHHGPSMQYSSHMLPGLALLARQTGHPAIRDAAARQAAFLIDWAFPDGVTAGAFDGRRCTALGAIVPGMELVPEGLAYMRRAAESWERAGWLDPDRRDAPPYRRPFKGDFISAEALLYFGDGAAVPPTGGAPLPMDTDGMTLERHTACFDGTLARRGPWAIALSSQISDVPKDTGLLYRLERQNRIELWHRQASVLVGGGHTLLTAEQPLFNAWVDTGFRHDPPRHAYYPRAARSGAGGGTCWLELVFAHATVRFDLQALDDRLVVRYAYRAMGVRELRLALTMMAWEGALAFADGTPLDRTSGRRCVNVTREVAVLCPAYGTRSVLQVPRSGLTRAHFPLPVMENYHPVLEGEPLQSVIALALVETVLPDPGEAGGGQWTVRVEDTRGRHA